MDSLVRNEPYQWVTRYKEDVAERRAVVRSVDGQAKAVEHRGLLLRELDRNVFEPDRLINKLGDIGARGSAVGPF